ncbi:ATP-binding protein [Nonomuraea aridisoli]|uniref:Uncharacterized protein n=1 Tax=Nonomuraea aridisoli TaxID=2070368 RepID=A0A2W2ED56_9ACTN|nr:hypothetical protein [Nonomuraea aridisoli]PZG11540.1 hypothetical protein C1J01_34570 [Nonomuraea aridisoli]
MVAPSARRLAIGLVTAVSCAYTAIALLYSLNDPLHGTLAVLAILAVVTTHHVNMRAALRGERPALHPLTLVLQAVVTYLPDPLLPGGMSAVNAPLLAGTLLVSLPLRVREAVTNVLRHSRATTCTITTSRHDGTLRLEIANDGTPAAAELDALGGGLTSLAERAAQAGGSCNAAPTGAGGFVLTMEVAMEGAA